MKEAKLVGIPGGASVGRFSIIASVMVFPRPSKCLAAEEALARGAWRALVGTGAFRKLSVLNHIADEEMRSGKPSIGAPIEPSPSGRGSCIFLALHESHRYHMPIFFRF